MHPSYVALPRRWYANLDHDPCWNCYQLFHKHIGPFIVFADGTWKITTSAPGPDHRKRWTPLKVTLLATGDEGWRFTDMDDNTLKPSWLNFDGQQYLVRCNETGNTVALCMPSVQRERQQVLPEHLYQSAALRMGTKEFGNPEELWRRWPILGEPVKAKVKDREAADVSEQRAWIRSAVSTAQALAAMNGQPINEGMRMMPFALPDIFPHWREFSPTTVVNALWECKHAASTARGMKVMRQVMADVSAWNVCLQATINDNLRTTALVHTEFPTIKTWPATY